MRCLVTSRRHQRLLLSSSRGEVLGHCCKHTQFCHGIFWFDDTRTSLDHMIVNCWYLLVKAQAYSRNAMSRTPSSAADRSQEVCLSVEEAATSLVQASRLVLS